MQLGVDGLRGLANYNIDDGVSTLFYPNLAKKTANPHIQRNGDPLIAELVTFYFRALEILQIYLPTLTGPLCNS